MKHLKTFEAYEGPIFPNSKFTQEDMDDLYDAFQDFAITYNIKDMTVNTIEEIPSHIQFAAYDDPDGEVNQYIIGQSKYSASFSFIDIKLFDNVDEIIETLRDNFIPQVKSLGWYIHSPNNLQDDMTITEEDNDETETPYTAVSITFSKKDI